MPQMSSLRIDPHVHTLASDGIDDVETMIQAAIASGLDAIAIADHERIDAAVAGQAMAEYRGWPIEVIVGEEISTRGGHLLGLYLKQRIRPWHSLKDSIARVHEQGGLAIIAHPLPPYPLCASEGTIRKLMDEADPIYHPDGIEGFNPTTAGAPCAWSRRAPALAEELGIAATGGLGCPQGRERGHDPDASCSGAARSKRACDGPARSGTRAGRARPTAGSGQLGMFGQQQRKNLAAAGRRDQRQGAPRRHRPRPRLPRRTRTARSRFDREAAGLPPEDERA